jgi:hypothetical protein
MLIGLEQNYLGGRSIWHNGMICLKFIDFNSLQQINFSRTTGLRIALVAVARSANIYFYCRWYEQFGTCAIGNVAPGVSMRSKWRYTDRCWNKREGALQGAPSISSRMVESEQPPVRR